MKAAPTLRAAIYARKSTDDSSRHLDNRSTTRQVDHARAFAKKKGWVVDDQHTYIDDNYSGSDFDRPGLLRLLSAIPKRGKPPFDVLVMSEPSRLGRDMLRTGVLLFDLTDAGIEVHYYLTDEQERMDTPEGRMMATLKGYGSEVERARIVQRTRDALEAKVKRGWSPGGRIYAYANYWVLEDGTRILALPGRKKPEGVDHSEYQVNESEAAVVRSIFTARRDGHGYQSIARALNGDQQYKEISTKYFGGRRINSPARGSGSWATGGVRKILRNPRYCGLIPWGKFRRKKKKRIRQETFHSIEAPHLKIVKQDLWDAVQTAMGPEHRKKGEAPVLYSVSKKTGKRTQRMKGGRQGWNTSSRFLLSGMAHCSCGASITGVTRKWSAGGRLKATSYYRCSANQNRGETLCKNNHSESGEEISGRVLDAIEKKLLSPSALDHVVRQAHQMVLAEKKLRPDRRAQIKRDIEQQQKELQRYISSFGKSDTSPAELVSEIERRKQEIKALGDELQNAEAIEVPTKFELKRIRKELGRIALRFKRTLRRDPAGARVLLRQLLVAPLKFHPVERNGRRKFAFQGAMTIGPLVDVVCMRERSTTR